MADAKLSEALALLASVLRRDIDHLTPEYISVHFREQPDRPMPLPFPKPAAEGSQLDDNEHTALVAVAEIGGAPKAPVVAKVAGMKYDQNFRALMSRLRRLGYLGGAPGESGYPLTEAGEAALAAREPGV